jgi:hypothetical protein
MVALASAPPSAVLSTSAGQVPLAVSAWCLGVRCGAPIGAAHRIAFAKLGETVHVVLKFVPRAAKVEVGGIRMKTTIAGSELSWVVRRGVVAYVGRLRLR